MAQKKSGNRVAAQNRKAFHDYFVEERYEAGISLAGTEVKSIRQGTLNLKDSFCVVKDGEIFVHGMHISPYEKGNIFNKDPMRPRRLLMHKEASRVKVELGLCKGKKLYDKRASSAERDAKREIDRTMKQRR